VERPDNLPVGEGPSGENAGDSRTDGGNQGSVRDEGTGNTVGDNVEDGKLGERAIGNRNSEDLRDGSDLRSSSGDQEDGSCLSEVQKEERRDSERKGSSEGISPDEGEASEGGNGEATVGETEPCLAATGAGNNKKVGEKARLMEEK